MTIETILARKGRDCVTVTPDATVGHVVGLLAERALGAVLVLDGGRVNGIFSERDVVRHLQRLGAALLERPVSTVMSSPVITCQPSDGVEQVMAIMTQRGIRHMPVLDGDRLVGMISIRDLVRQRLSDKELEAAVLLDISRLHG